MNTKSFRALAGTIAIAGAIVAPVAAHAQYGGGYGYGNQGYGNQRYGNQNWSIRSYIDAVERSSNAFRNAVENRADRVDDARDDRWNRNNDWLRNRDRFFDALKPNVQRMDQAFERLRREADNRRPRQGRDEMYDVIRYASQVDRYFNYSVNRDRGYVDRYYNNRFGYVRDYDRDGDIDTYDYNRSRYDFGFQRTPDLTARWRTLRSDINNLARQYGLPTLDQYRSGARLNPNYRNNGNRNDRYYDPYNNRDYRGGNWGN